MAKYRVCERDVGGNNLRLGICFECATFESLIQDGIDMYDNEADKKINGSPSLNILRNILEAYRVVKL